jgi:Protein of unknown function (DUF2934)
MDMDGGERLRRRAYELWQQEDRPEGRALDHWLRAEAELAAETSGPARHPGDEAPAGSPQTGEHICPDCHGEGHRDGEPCATCGGTGRVVRIIGDA